MQVLASHCYSLVVAHLPVVQIEERHPSGRVDVPHALLPVVPSTVCNLLTVEAFQEAPVGREEKLPGTIHAQVILGACKDTKPAFQTSIVERSSNAASDAMTRLP